MVVIATSVPLAGCGAEPTAGRGGEDGDGGLAGGAGEASEIPGGHNQGGDPMSGAGNGAGAECDPDACPAVVAGATKCCTSDGQCGRDRGDGAGCVPPTSTTGGGPGSADGGAPASGGGGVPGDPGGGGTPPASGPPAELPKHRCNEAPPPGAALAAAPPTYSGGMCPTLVDGMNTLGGRKVILAIPAGVTPAEKMPVIFLWHWLGGDAMSFYDKAQVRQAVDQQRFIAAIPEESGMFLFRWPATSLDPPGTENVDLKVFDDVLACVSQQFNFNKECVASAGVSAGGIWTPQVAIHRSNRLSSIITLSGGTGAGFVKPFVPMGHKMPAIVLWGGPTDNCAGLASFDAASKDLENNLQANGHFFIECLHSCGHSQPPFTAPAGKSQYAGLWQFVFDHPFWLTPGDSPYKATGLPDTLPKWCGIGKGSAGPFTEMCTSPSQC
jgi:predicted esterase